MAVVALGGVMANQILFQSATGVLRQNTLILADKAGTGGTTISPAGSGASILFNGHRFTFVLESSNRTIDVSESCQLWVGTNAGGQAFTLPSGAPDGTTAIFMRAGGPLFVNPTNVGSIWHSTSGIFRPLGQSVQLTASGAMFGVISNGYDQWYPMLEKRTIE